MSDEQLLSGRHDEHYSILGPFVLPVASALHLRGEDPIQILHDVGIDAAKIANPDWRISIPKWHALMNRCVQITQDESFGLFAAMQLRPQVLSSLGLAWLASDTVYDGLQRMIRFSRLMSTAVRMTIEETGSLVNVHIELLVEWEPGLAPALDYSIGVIVRMSRLTMGEYLAPVRIAIERPAPADPGVWEYWFAAPVTFAVDGSCLSWARSDIVEPLSTGDPELARVNDEYTEVILATFLQDSISREVVDKIIQFLPDGPPSQVRVADALHVSTRTLQRKLQEENTSFVELLGEARLALARKYLRNPQRSVVETAYLLGFSEPSTFSRAFKRWTGQSPVEYRIEHSPS
ncbi:MAG: AraC family transcriptional regulator [Parahaliea sp.]